MAAKPPKAQTPSQTVEEDCSINILAFILLYMLTNTIPMKSLIIITFVAFTFAACTTKETKETNTETVTAPPAPEAPTVVEHTTTVVKEKEAVKENEPGFEMSVSDTGSGMRIKVPIKKR